MLSIDTTASTRPIPDGPTFLLGLPHASRGPLLETARRLGAPVLISANALSVWRKHDNGFRQWLRFRTSTLSALDGIDVTLDSAGFVAAQRYGRYPWRIDHYIDLCAAYPWQRCFAMDFCVEPEIAADRATVLDRISKTVHVLRRCLRASRERGIEQRLAPVLQGWEPQDYARCLNRMGDVVERSPIVGVGSVCRRPIHGNNGIIAVVNRIDQELGASTTRLHLFGVKGAAATILRHHPRVASYDSQAYGTRARVLAREGGFSKSNAFVATVMTDWYDRQQAAMNQPTQPLKPRQLPINFDHGLTFDDPIEQRIEAAREEIRALVEAGEMDASWLTEERAFHWAFDGADDDPDL
jgi:hypothetical protein